MPVAVFLINKTVVVFKVFIAGIIRRVYINHINLSGMGKTKCG